MAATHFIGPVQDFAALASWFVVPFSALALWLVLHEVAHAIVAWLVRFRVHAIQLGGGPASFACWIGRTNLVLCRWPTHGWVFVVFRHRRLLRTRMVSFFAAGPASDIAFAAALHHVTWYDVAFSPWHEVLRPGLMLASCLAWLLAAVSLVPRRFRDGSASDAWNLLDALRLDIAGVRAIEQAAPVAEAQFAFWRCFVTGDLVGAAHALGPMPDAFGARCNWFAMTSLLAFATEGGSAWMPAQHEAERWVRSPPSDDAPESPADAQVRSRWLRSFEVNRAYFLIHSDLPEQRAEALTIVEGWPSIAPADLGGRVAEYRTRGLVLLHHGRTVAGMRELRRALAAVEPYWLRALGFSYLAYGHARRGEGRIARRCVRRAARLAPGLPLLADRLRLVEAALAAAPERAPVPAVR